MSLDAVNALSSVGSAPLLLFPVIVMHIIHDTSHMHTGNKRYARKSISLPFASSTPKSMHAEHTHAHRNSQFTSSCSTEKIK